MPVESPINDLSSLNENWPLDEELQSFTDDHLRLIKDALKKGFVDLGANGGVVTVTAAELNHLTGAVANVQAQIDDASPSWRYTAATLETLTGNDKLLADPPFSGVVMTLPDSPTNGTEIQIIDVGGNAAPPNNTVTVQRSGFDTIFDLDTWTSGLSTIQLGNNGEYRYFAYDAANTRWFTWSVNS